MPSVPARRIRWDIYEEHLDEAAFLFQQWEEALRSPLYTLVEIAEGPEERLLAQVDGLVLAGDRIASRLLLPALEGEPPVAFAAAFALLAHPEGRFLDSVLAALPELESQQRAALRRALGLAPRPELGALLKERLAADTDTRLDLLEVMAALRVDPEVRLELLASSPEPAQRALAFRLARVFPALLGPEGFEEALESPDAEVRAAAMEAGMLAGLGSALAAAEATVSCREPGFPAAALLLGLSGDPDAVEKLVPALGEKEVAQAATFGLGFTGRVTAADALLEAMKDEAVAPVAAEGFAAITGLVVEKELARPRKRWDPDAEEEREEPYGPEADLAKPNPEAIARWWKKARPRFERGARWSRGRPWKGLEVLDELLHGPARRRPALALDLEIRTRGQVSLAWDALSARQRQELAAAQPRAARASEKSYQELVRRP